MSLLLRMTLYRCFGSLAKRAMFTASWARAVGSKPRSKEAFIVAEEDDEGTKGEKSRAFLTAWAT
jgi:hypothetical protein